MTHFVYSYVYPKNKDERWELLYSIRSVYKNYDGEFDITIIGDIPDWINREEVRCIDYDNSDIKYKEARLNDKLIFASTLYNEFVTIHDDQYMFNKVKLSDIKNTRYRVKRHSHYLEYDYKLSNFESRQIATSRLCKELGVSWTYDYSTHTPSYVKKSIIDKVLSKTVLVKEDDRCPIFENIYYPFTDITPIKIDKAYLSIINGLTDQEEVHKDSLFLNHSDRGIRKRPEIKEILTKKFNEKCLAEM